MQQLLLLLLPRPPPDRCCCSCDGLPACAHRGVASFLPPLHLPLQVRDAPTWMRYVLPKGFVSVDGCSLTVGEVTPSSFSVYLIPETLRCGGGCVGWGCCGLQWGQQGESSPRC